MVRGPSLFTSSGRTRRHSRDHARSPTASAPSRPYGRTGRTDGIGSTDDTDRTDGSHGAGGTGGAGRTGGRITTSLTPS
ncbi:hypothetical protein ACIF8T_37385 [Streptomyces sp. NPDC085946]|uniref:hypothetical protein n=1 Tax=Streptomyces sp. NPDC085946 TaxID=3365744 RepID=UPI0037D07333